MCETLAEFQIRGTAPDSSDRSKRTLHVRFLRRCTIHASEILILVITDVEFLWSSGTTCGGMILSFTRSCTFMRESSFNENGARGGIQIGTADLVCQPCP